MTTSASLLTRGRIVVGVDSSDQSHQALAWALQEASLRQAVLEVVHVVDEHAGRQHRHRPADDDRQQRFTDSVRKAIGDDITVTVEPLVLSGDPAGGLCMRGDRADLLVVGSRGRSAAAGALLGSVSSNCAHQSQVPVVIVPGRQKQTRAETSDTAADVIVVGIDGSPGSQLALRWAVGEAALRRAHVEAVAVWRTTEAPTEMDVELAMFPSISRHDQRLAEVMQERLQAVLSALAREPTSVEVGARLLEGRPADVLCARAERASLLVVGSRGLGAVAGMLLGSVSIECARRSPRPVVIIPAAPGLFGAAAGHE